MLKGVGRPTEQAWESYEITIQLRRAMTDEERSWPEQFKAQMLKGMEVKEVSLGNKT